MRFRVIDAARKDFPVASLCKVLAVSPSGYFGWKNRPASTRQREALVLLAHVRSALTLSHETYGSPPMTHELREQGLAAGRRRVARLMRENGLKARQPRRFRRTTDSGPAVPVAPNRRAKDFTAAGPDRKWGADISYVWTREGWLYRAGCTWRWSSICTPDGSWAGRWAIAFTRNLRWLRCDVPFGLAHRVPDASRGYRRAGPLHRWLLQSPTPSLGTRLHKPHPVREGHRPPNRSPLN